MMSSVWVGESEKKREDTQVWGSSRMHGDGDGGERSRLWGYHELCSAHVFELDIRHWRGSIRGAVKDRGLELGDGTGPERSFRYH